MWTYLGLHTLWSLPAPGDAHFEDSTVQIAVVFFSPAPRPRDQQGYSSRTGMVHTVRVCQYVYCTGSDYMRVVADSMHICTDKKDTVSDLLGK